MRGEGERWEQCLKRARGRFPATSRQQPLAHGLHPPCGDLPIESRPNIQTATQPVNQKRNQTATQPKTEPNKTTVTQGPILMNIHVPCICDSLGLGRSLSKVILGPRPWWVAPRPLTLVGRTRLRITTMQSTVPNSQHLTAAVHILLKTSPTKVRRLRTRAVPDTNDT